MIHNISARLHEFMLSPDNLIKDIMQYLEITVVWSYLDVIPFSQNTLSAETMLLYRHIVTSK